MDTDEAVRLRRVISTLARHLHTSSTDEGLTPTQASVLARVAAREPVSLSELVRLEHLNPTMVSRVIARLDEAGLIVRAPAPEDQRSVLLTATADGHAMHERIRARRAAAVSSGAQELTAAEQHAIIRALPALERLAEHIR
jgi:DNA-binding MarR family transcriptional regulator